MIFKICIVFERFEAGKTKMFGSTRLNPAIEKDPWGIPLAMKSPGDPEGHHPALWGGVLGPHPTPVYIKDVQEPERNA